MREVEQLFRTYKFYYTAQIGKKNIEALGYKPEEFLGLQDDIEELGSAAPGAALNFVAKMADRKLHPNREFKVEIISPTAAIARNPLAPTGLCCLLLLEIKDNQMQVTASKGNDWLGVKIPDDRSESGSFQYAFWERRDKEVYLAESDPLIGFMSPPVDLPVYFGDKTAEDKTAQQFVNWLQRYKRTPEQLGLTRYVQPMLVSALNAG